MTDTAPATSPSAPTEILPPPPQPPRDAPDHPRSRRLDPRRISPLWPALGAVALLTAWAVHARTRDLGAQLWIDEGISLGIARHAFTAIPGVLGQDGSPPLYYLLLHVWGSLFGFSPRSGHALSLAAAAAAVPAAYWAASRPFGRWAGVLAAAVIALDPFAGEYAVEVRMYSLLLLCGVLSTGAFLRAFVVAPGERRWAVALAVALAATMYTHNWGLFLGVAAGAVWLVLLATAGDGQRRRALLIGGAIAFGGAALLFLPWVPSLLQQAAHTGAPWSHAPHWRSVSRAFARILGGTLPETVLLLTALVGVVTLLRPWSRPQAKGELAVLGLALLTFVVAYAWSNVSSPAWALRYLSIVLAPAAIAIAAGLARTGIVAVVVMAVVFLGSWYGKPSHSSLAHKSNVRTIAHRLGTDLPGGSVVYASQPEQVPVLRYYLRADLRYVTPLGPSPDPQVMDWRDAMKRLDRPSSARVLPRLIARMKPGDRMLIVQPHFAHPTSPWIKRIRELTHDATRTIHRDHAIVVIGRVKPYRGYNRSTLTGLLVERRRHAASSSSSQTG